MQEMKFKNFNNILCDKRVVIKCKNYRLLLTQTVDNVTVAAFNKEIKYGRRIRISKYDYNKRRAILPGLYAIPDFLIKNWW